MRSCRNPRVLRDVLGDMITEEQKGVWWRGKTYEQEQDGGT